jgi:hypothetical protein
MANKYDINWEAVRERAQKIAEQPPPGERGGEREESKFFSMVDPGLYKYRIVPAGNYITGVPWKEVVRHELPIVTERGRDTVIYVLCWHWIAREKKEIGKPLAQAGKLVKADTDKYREFGCPVCGVRKEFYRANAKEAADRIGPRTKYFWNIIPRTMIDIGNGQKVPNTRVYVLSTSMTLGETLIDSIHAYRDEGKNIIDLKKGHDYQITAVGPNNLTRRYKSPMWGAMPRPALKEGLESIEPYDLTEVVMEQFKGFQETIDALHQSMSKVMAKNGITVPGDESSWNSNSLKEDDDDIFSEVDAEEEDALTSVEEEESEEEEYVPPRDRPMRKSAKVTKTLKAPARDVRPGVGGKKKKTRREVGEGQTGVKIGKTKIMDNGLDDDDIPF